MTLLRSKIFLLCCLLVSLPLGAHAAESAGATAAHANGSGFVAHKDSVQAVFNALSSKMGKPVILSRLAMKKQVSGDFNFASPWNALQLLSEQLSLIWYFDGQSVYVYDASETKNSVVSLHNVELKTLISFLSASGLYDKRYPLKGGAGFGPFYVSGPPVYVDIIVNSAAYMDKRYSNVDLGSERIEVIPLRNTFVGDRSYKLRDQSVTVPGIASVIQSILRAAGEQPVDGVNRSQTDTADAPAAPAVPKPSLASLVFNPSAPLPGFNPRRTAVSDNAATSQRIGIEPVPENNSLLVKGRADQIDFIKNLVHELDIAKRHVELALWIIDISKNSFEDLGVKWGASLNAGPLSVRMNGSQLPETALDGQKFLAEISALNQKGKADVVTRPVVLTQENVPAIFDHNQTFYTRVSGERTAQLEHVTYGTMISVLPRVSGDAKEIEMVLNIEDGNADNNSQSSVDSMPLVRRTQISTVARVPRGKSLLVGGYALNSTAADGQKLPLLGDIPLIGGLFSYSHNEANNRLRLFLIEPRVLENGAGWDADSFNSAQNPGSASSVLRTLGKLREYMDGHAIN